MSLGMSRVCQCHASMSHVFSAMLMPGKVSTDGANGSSCMLNRVCACVAVGACVAYVSPLCVCVE